MGVGGVACISLRSCHTLAMNLQKYILYLGKILLLNTSASVSLLCLVALRQGHSLTRSSLFGLVWLPSHMCHAWLLTQSLETETQIILHAEQAISLNHLPKPHFFSATHGSLFSINLISFLQYLPFLNVSAFQAFIKYIYNSFCSSRTLSILCK